VDLFAELRLAGHLRRVPVVALTAQALAGDAERFRAAGFAVVITKPIDTRAFVTSLERLVARRGGAIEVLG
jgi:CheY-like chemotaxis protein